MRASRTKRQRPVVGRRCRGALDANARDYALPTRPHALALRRERTAKLIDGKRRLSLSLSLYDARVLYRERRIAGNNLRKVFSQKYHGDCTISPKFTYLQTIGLTAICNPTKPDMIKYLRGGKPASPECFRRQGERERERKSGKPPL